MLGSVLPAVLVQTQELVGSVACLLTYCIPVDIMHICAAQTRKFERPEYKAKTAVMSSFLVIPDVVEVRTQCCCTSARFMVSSDC